MPNALRRTINLTFAFLLAVFSINLSGVLSLQNAYATPPGNNGTLKIHEKGTPSGTESNDPKVCKFNFEGFGFDASQTGYIKIATQPGGVDSLSPSLYPFGPANGSGNWTSGTYINDGGTYTLPNGQYKATLYGKDTNNPNLPNLNDEKAKSKVFKVNCDITPAAPTKNDPCGVSSDSYTIPTTEGVKYQVKIGGGNYSDKAAGTYTYTGAGTVYVKAVSLDNDTDLTAPNQWTFAFTNADCVVIPTAPSKIDPCGTASDTYMIPTTEGVTYKIWNGSSWVTKAAGTYAGSSTVKIKAFENAGYDLSGSDDQYEWTFTFSAAPCVITVTADPATAADELCGAANDTYTIPNTTGVQYYINGSPVSAGTYNTNGALFITVTAQAKPGYQLSGTASWPLTFTNKSCVTPADPTKIDLCGKTNDKYTIPATTGVVYKVNGVTKAAGTYQTNSDVTITAEAFNGNYVLTGTTSWPLDFSQDKCPAAATKPQLVEVCGTLGDRFVIPTIVGVEYEVSKFGILYDDISAGSHWGAGTFYVKAVAKPGYELTGDKQWVLYLNPDRCDADATPPTMHDECDTQNDIFTIPTTAHVTYKLATWKWFTIAGIPIFPYLDYDTIPAGEHAGSGTVIIKAFADQNYTIPGTDKWTFTFSDESCDTEVEAVPTPEFFDGCGEDGNYFTIPEQEGVTYYNGDTILSAGTHYHSSGMITIHAEADEGYVLPDESFEWSHAFTYTDCPVEPCEPEMVPALSLTQVLTDDDCEPGMGGGGGETPETPTTPPTPATPVTPTGIMLPETGANPIAQAFTLLIAGVTTYGIMFFIINRRTLASKK